MKLWFAVSLLLLAVVAPAAHGSFADRVRALRLEEASSAQQPSSEASYTLPLDGDALLQVLDRNEEEALLSGDAEARKFSLGLKIGRFSGGLTLGDGKPKINAAYETKSGHRFGVEINKPGGGHSLSYSYGQKPEQPTGPEVIGPVGGEQFDDRPGQNQLTGPGPIDVNGVMVKIDHIIDELVEPQDEDDEPLMESFALLVCRKMQAEFDKYDPRTDVGCRDSRVECETGFLAAKSEFGRAADGIFKAAAKQCRFQWAGVEDEEDDDEEEDDDDDKDPLAENCAKRQKEGKTCDGKKKKDDDDDDENDPDKQRKTDREMSKLVAGALKKRELKRKLKRTNQRLIEADKKIEEESEEKMESMDRELLKEKRKLKHKKCHHKHGKKCCNKKHKAPAEELLDVTGATSKDQSQSESHGDHDGHDNDDDNDHDQSHDETHDETHDEAHSGESDASVTVTSNKGDKTASSTTTTTTTTTTPVDPHSDEAISQDIHRAVAAAKSPADKSLAALMLQAEQEEQKELSETKKEEDMAREAAREAELQSQSYSDNDIQNISIKGNKKDIDQKLGDDNNEGKNDDKKSVRNMSVKDIEEEERKNKLLIEKLKKDAAKPLA